MKEEKITIDFFKSKEGKQLFQCTLAVQNETREHLGNIKSSLEDLREFAVRLEDRIAEVEKMNKPKTTRKRK